MTDTTKCNDGFTLVELVIASAVLLTVLTSVVGVLVFSAQSAQMQRQKEGATNIANEKLETARNLPYDRLGVAGKSPSGDVLATEVVRGYTVNTVIEWQQDPATGTRMDKKVSVDVTWSLPKVGHLVLSTDVFGKSLLSNVGDVEVRVRYAKDSQPVAAVSCAVASMSGTTNSKGIAFFGAVPIGVYNDNDPANTKKITVVPPAGYVYNAADVQAKSVAADSLTTIIVTLQKASSVKYTFIDAETTAVISGASLTLSRTDGSAFGVPVVTDTSGNATFSGLSVGEYLLNYTASGYSCAPQSLSVATEDSHPEITVPLSSLPKIGSISVLVTDANTPLTNATVTVVGTAGNSVAPQSTSDSGLATFSNLPPDTYKITVTCDRYQSQDKTITLVAGKSETPVFILATTSTKGSMTITTQQNGSVHGDIKVNIYVYKQSWNSWNYVYYDSETSNSNGSIQINDLPAGAYGARANSNPSPNSVTPVTITNGANAIVSVNRSSNWWGW